MVTKNISNYEFVNRIDSSDEAILRTSILSNYFTPSKDKIFYSVSNTDGSTSGNTNFYASTLINSNGKSNVADISIIKEVNDFITKDGVYNVNYRFYEPFITKIFISDISPDRTEILLKFIDNIDLAPIRAKLSSLSSDSLFYFNNILSWNSKDVSLIIDWKISNSNLILKLYQPLQSEVTTKTEVSWDIEVAKSVKFDVIVKSEDEIKVLPRLKQADFSNKLPAYSSINISDTFTSDTIDYSKFENFVHFSSAEDRLLNAVYKIDKYRILTNDLQNNNTLQNQLKINSELDSLNSELTGYEKYIFSIYPTSGGFFLPQTDNLVISWLNDIQSDASEYDSENLNALANWIPKYIKEDERNEAFSLLVSVIAEVADLKWLQSKKITDFYNPDMTEGISADLVSIALNQFGYNQDISKTDEVKKRIYGNVPLLSKTAGTSIGKTYLMNCYGIPRTHQFDNLGFTKQSFSYAYKLSANSYINVPFTGDIKTIECYFLFDTNLRSGTIFKIGNLLTLTQLSGTDFNLSVSGGGSVQFSTNDNNRPRHISITRNYQGNGTMYILRVNNSNNYFRQAGLFVANDAAMKSYNGTIAIGGTSALKMNEFRLWTSVLPTSILNTHTSNRRSIAGLQPESYKTELVYRLPFGSNLQTGSLVPISYGNLLTGSLTMSGVGSYEQAIIDKSNIYDYIEETPSKYLSVFNSTQTFNAVKPLSRLVDLSYSPSSEFNKDVIETTGAITGSIEPYINAYKMKIRGRYKISNYIRIAEKLDNSLFVQTAKSIPVQSSAKSGVSIHPTIFDSTSVNLRGFSASFQIAPLATLKKSSIVVKQVDTVKIDIDTKTKDINPNKFKGNKKTDTFKVIQHIPYVGNIVKGVEKLVSRNVTIPTDYPVYNRESKGLGDMFFNGISQSGLINESVNAPIQRYSDLVGLYTEQYNSVIYPDSTFLFVKYLVDNKGNLTDLNELNRHIYDQQNLFQADKNVVLAPIESGKFNSKNSFSGKNLVKSSGIRFSPVIFGSQTENTYQFKDKNEVSYLAHSIIKDDVKIDNKAVVGNIFNKVVVNQNDVFDNQVYTVPIDGQYRIDINAILKFRANIDTDNASYKICVYKNVVKPENIIEAVRYDFDPRRNGYDANGKPTTADPVLTKKALNSDQDIDSQNAFTRHFSSEESSFYDNPMTYSSKITWSRYEDAQKFSANGYFLKYISSTGVITQGLLYYEIYESTNIFGQQKFRTTNIVYDFWYPSYLATVNLSTVNNKSNSKNLPDENGVFNEIDNVPTFFKKGDKLIVQLERVNVNGDPVVTLKAGSYLKIYRNKGKVELNNPPIKTVESDRIGFDRGIGSVMVESGSFIPSGSLADKYGTEIEELGVKPNDKIAIHYSVDDEIFYRTVTNIKDSLADDLTYVYLNERIPDYVDVNYISEWVIYRDKLDETVVEISRKLSSGSVNYGLLLPDNLNPYFLDNYNDLIKELKTKIINPATNNIN